MNKSFTPEGLQFAWDSTSLELAQTCLRKYYYSMHENLVPVQKSVHLIFGGIYAAALEQFYKLRANGVEIEPALHAVVRDALIASWNHDRDSEGVRLLGTGQPINFDHSAKTRENLIRSIIWYLDKFADESEESIKTHILPSGKAAVELSFVLDFGNDLLYCGHLDRVGEYGGHLYWLDNKTTGSTISPRFFEGFALSNQFYGYTWAGQAILGSPVRGGIIDGAQIAVGFTRFERGFFSTTQAQLDEWVEHTHYTIEAAHRASREHEFPMNRTACGNYGGCQFRDICSRSPHVRDNFIRGGFVHREPWDPLTPR